MTGRISHKVMILAAGKGSRLGPATEQVPKPMLSIGGRPILAWTVERLANSGISEIVINLHHAPTVIPEYFGDGAAFGVRIAYSFEPEILGTAGGVKHAQRLLDGAPFLVVYGDNVLDWDPTPLIEGHRVQPAAVTIAVAEVPDARQSGVVHFNPAGDILSFVEKPGELTDPRGWVNAGVYVLDPIVFDHIADGVLTDFGFHVFPRLLELGLPLRAFPLQRPPLAVDTPVHYELAQRSWPARDLSGN